jgi:putative PIN family toxin of toxin-antitoxin system
MSEAQDIQSQKLRIIVDTNLFVSFLITKNFQFLNNLLSEDKVDIVVCDELLEEIEEVCTRPKFKTQITSLDLQKLLEMLSSSSLSQKILSEVNVSRDLKDNYLLALAKDSDADFLITGDKDLLSINKFSKTHIITISEFKQLSKNL